MDISELLIRSGYLKEDFDDYEYWRALERFSRDNKLPRLWYCDPKCIDKVIEIANNNYNSNQ